MSRALLVGVPFADMYIQSNFGHHVKLIRPNTQNFSHVETPEARNIYSTFLMNIKDLAGRAKPDPRRGLAQ